MSDKKYPKLTEPIEEPDRNPDYHSKRGIPYWWAPEWVKKLNNKYCRIIPLKKGDDVELHAVSKDGNLTYIRGSIQQACKDWHADNQIDYILLGMNEDDLISPDWEREGE